MIEALLLSYALLKKIRSHRGEDIEKGACIKAYDAVRRIRGGNVSVALSDDLDFAVDGRLECALENVGYLSMGVGVHSADSAALKASIYRHYALVAGEDLP